MAEVKIPGITRDNATLLLAAAEELNLGSSVVRTTSSGHFLVPEEVAKAAGLLEGDNKTDDEKPARRPAKKAAAKKAAETEE